MPSRRFSKLKLPPIPKTEKYTIKLKVVFASLDGKDSDEDAARFHEQLDTLLNNFKPKSEFKQEITTERVGRKLT